MFPRIMLRSLFGKSFHDKAYCPESRLPVAKLLGETSLCFLIHPTLTEDHINQTCQSLENVMKMAAGCS